LGFDGKNRLPEEKLKKKGRWQAEIWSTIKGGGLRNLSLNKLEEGRRYGRGRDVNL